MGPCPVWMLAAVVVSGAEIRRIEPDPRAKTSAAVVVDADVPLLLTGQLLPEGGGGAERQAAELLDRLDALLKERGTGPAALVRLNVYAVDDRALSAFRKVLAARPGDGGGPTLVHVVTGFGKPGVSLGLDAVAAGPKDNARTSVAAVLPSGRRVFVSGQARPGKTLEEAATATLEELDGTLAFLKLDRTKVVHVKTFVQPVGSVDVVDRALAKFFGAGKVPPRSHVEWRSSATSPIEIELVVAGGEAAGSGVAYLTPPDLKASPVFSRVARLDGGDLIFTSSLVGPAGGDGKAQVEGIFSELTRLTAASGSDLKHLAKATYYVADDEPSKALNDLRPKYYDPARPPAASKAMVTGVGLPGRSIAVDLIAVRP